MMGRVDELRAQLAVAELEDQLAAVKSSGTDAAAVKGELRYARWVARGGPAEEETRLAAGDGHTNRATADLYARWLAGPGGEG